MALVGYGNLGGSPDSPQAEFSEQSPLVNFLEESGAKRVGHLKDGAKHAFGQRIESVFIGVHRRPIIFVASETKASHTNLWPPIMSVR